MLLIYAMLFSVTNVTFEKCDRPPQQAVEAYRAVRCRGLYIYWKIGK
jgi:hypothetical protein